jgi:hypothetical protein
MKLIKSTLMTVLLVTLAIAGSVIAYRRGHLTAVNITNLIPPVISNGLPPQLAFLKTTAETLPEVSEETQSEPENSDQSSEEASPNDLKSKLSFDSDGASNQIQILAERGQEVGGHVGNVLGSYVQVSDAEEQPLHESAFEYGRYLYCQQVVNEFEKSPASENSSEPITE